MAQRDFFNFTVRLESPINYVELPVKIEKPIKKLKIKSVFFQTANVDSESLMVNVNGFNDNSAYIGRNISRQYTLIIPLNKQVFAQNYYLNKSSTEEFDVIRKEPINVPNLQIDLYINNEVRPTEITPTNPVILEIYLSV
jgi:hypothetical protein